MIQKSNNYKRVNDADADADVDYADYADDDNYDDDRFDVGRNESLQLFATNF